MTAYLQLKLNQPATRSPSGHGAVVTVRQVADENGNFPETPFETAVVAGGGLLKDDVPVPPGRYRLEARLPSGRVLRESRVVTKDSRELVQFNVGGSGHEWLGWQTVSGNVPSLDQYLARRRADDRSDAFHGPLRFLLARSTLERLIRPRPLTPVVERHADEIVSLWSLRFSDVWLDRTIGQLGDAPAQRVVAALPTPSATLLAFLPVPWMTHLDEPAELELLYDPSIPNDRGLRVSVVDSQRSALLSYLGASRMVEATVAFEAAEFGERVLFEMETKRENPLAAAAAAYIGLAYPVGDHRRERWSPWLTNLMNWFPSIPDGAILRARDLIERAATEEDLVEALKALAVAFRRGPPYFSAGVRHLLDGLNLFSSSAERYGFRSGLVRAMHADVARFALLTDPIQTFTVLKLRPGFLNKLPFGFLDKLPPGFLNKLPLGFLNKLPPGFLNKVPPAFFNKVPPGFFNV